MMMSTSGPRILARITISASRHPSKSSWLLGQTAGTASNMNSTRTYVSRAHPRPVALYPIPEALDLVMVEVDQRKQKRKTAWKRTKTHRRTKETKPDDGEPYRYQNETIELALNMNIDPRKPGQALRGSVELPHGTGRPVQCVVFTTDDDFSTAAKEAGALHVGGDELMDELAQGNIPLDSFQRALATTEMMPSLSRTLARVLGPRGLMPNPKVGTVGPPAQLLETLQTQLAGKEVPYRTDKEGILHFPIGKGSFPVEQLLDNASAIMTTVYAAKPESYGKAKKKKAGGGGGGKSKGSGGKGAQYLLSAFITSTYTKSFKLDVRTLDPSSAFFMSTVSEDADATAAA